MTTTQKAVGGEICHAKVIENLKRKGEGKGFISRLIHFYVKNGIITTIIINFK